MKRLGDRMASNEAIDIKSISDKLEQLPHDKLMYVAGAITALAATMPDEGRDAK